MLPGAVARPGLDSIRNLNLPDEDRKNIFHRDAEAVLRLK
jgi:hypothetical protein